MSSFRDLIAWQKAMELAQEIYSVSATFPADERYGLTAQLRRAAVSIPSNIAEGDGRLTNRDWQHFLATARGSALELETQLILATRLGYGARHDLEQAIAHAQEIGRIINGLLRSTRTRTPRKFT